MDNQRQNPRVEKFARALLATTCLTAASGVAGASTIVEGTAPGPTSFGSTFGTATLLPVGTTSVQGFLNTEGDCCDFFEFQGLLPASSFSVTAFTIPNSVEGEAGVGIFNSSQALLGVIDLEGSGGTYASTVPSDGNLIVEAIMEAPNDGGITQLEYEVNLSAQVAPEPSTLATAGLALASALAWRRRRQPKS